MYPVLDICRYIINYSNKKNYEISNLKLQKLLYFVQACFLCFSQDKKPCFPEQIEAWDFGPVVPQAYHEYKQYGSGHIPPVDSYLSLKTGDIWEIERVPYHDNIIAEKDKEMIERVVDQFASFSATDLVTLTHHQAPWKQAYQPHANQVIRNEAIKEYFDEP